MKAENDIDRWVDDGENHLDSERLEELVLQSEDLVVLEAAQLV